MVSNSKFRPSANYIPGDLTVGGNIIGGNIATGSGETNTASNVGTGQGVFKEKSGVDLRFRSLLATGSSALVSGSNEITVSSSYAPASYYQDGGAQEIVISNLLGEAADAQKVSVGLNNAAPVGSRHILNFRTGSNIGITVAEDAGNDRINITITSSAGGGTPAGNSGAVQYNNSSSFGGSNNWTFNADDRLRGASPLVLVSASTGAPGPASSSAETFVYSRNIAGLNMPAWISSGSLPTAGSGTMSEALIQPAFMGRNMMWVNTGHSNTLRQMGVTMATSGTVSHPAIAATSFLTQMRRFRILSAATSGAMAAARSTLDQCWRGNKPNQGGFMLFTRFCWDLNIPGSRAFVGVSANGSEVAGTANPSTVANTIGIGFDSSDAVSGSWSIIGRDASNLTKIPMANVLRDSNEVFDFWMYAKPNDNKVGFKVMSAASGTVLYEDTNYTGSLPTNTSMLTFDMSTANTSGSAVSMMVQSIYLESQN